MLVICRNRFHRSYHRLCLCRLRRFRHFGSNLLPCGFCDLLGQLGSFYKTAIFLRIDSLSIQLLRPIRGIITGLDILGVQLIGNTLAVLAACNSFLFNPGQFLACSLLCQRCCNSTYITGFSKFSKPGFCCCLDRRHILCRHCCLILLHKTVQLTTGEVLSAIQSGLHLLRKGIVRVDFQCLANQFLLTVPVSVFGIIVLAEGLIRIRGDCATTFQCECRERSNDCGFHHCLDGGSIVVFPCENGFEERFQVKLKLFFNNFGADVDTNLCGNTEKCIVDERCFCKQHIVCNTSERSDTTNKVLEG